MQRRVTTDLRSSSPRKTSEIFGPATLFMKISDPNNYLRQELDSASTRTVMDTSLRLVACSTRSPWQQ